MRRGLWAGILPALLALLIGPGALAQDKGNLTDKQLDALKAKLLAGSSVDGQLTTVDTEAKQFSFRAVTTIQVTNQQQQQRLTQLQQQYNNAIRQTRPNQGQVAKLTNDIRDAQSKLYDNKDVTFDFELKGTDKLHIRTQNLPPKEGGGTYTAAEKQKLKGTGPLPGYSASLADLSKDVWVRAYLDRSKTTKKRKDEDPLPVLTLMIIPAKEATTPKKKN
jgi:hypothetical protein